MTWMSRGDANANKRAHFVEADGRPACLTNMGTEQWPQLALVTGPWVERDPWHHLCGFCRKFREGTCLCSRCRAKTTQAPSVTPKDPR